MEFTLLVPIALVLILGVVDLGKATSYWLDSSHLANEGARAAAVTGCPQDPLNPPGTCDHNLPTYPSAFVVAIRNQAETTQLRNNTTVCVWDFDPSGALRPAGAPWVAHDEIRVTVSSVYDFLHFLNLASRTMTGRSTMRLETNWTFTPPSNPYGVNHSGPIGPPDCPALP